MLSEGLFSAAVNPAGVTGVTSCETMETELCVTEEQDKPL